MLIAKPTILTFASIILAPFVASIARADYNPIPIAPSSFNGDVVIENTAPQPIGLAVNATIDNGVALQTGNGTPYGATWNEVGYFTSNPTTGVPAAGTTFTAVSNNLIRFQMAPNYQANNAILIDGQVTNGTWVPVTPAAYSHLSFVSSGGNGGRIIEVIVKHQDGTTSTGTFASPDWFNGTVGVAWIARGRISAQAYTGDNLGTTNPRLYYTNLPLANASSPITNITLRLGVGGGSGHVGVMAVSGSTDGVNFSPIPVTGYNADVVVEATAPKTGTLKTATTLTMDGGTNNTGNTWYERGYQTFYPTSGLPLAGSTFASAALPTTYQMPPNYTANNVIFVESNRPVAIITPAAPAAYSALAILGATANGNVTNSLTIQYQDGSSEVQPFVARDWFNNTPFAYNANGRISTDTKTFSAVATQNPRLYETQLALGNTVSPVTNILLTWGSSGSTAARVFVFAISGLTGPVPPIIGDSPQATTIIAGTGFTLNATVTGGSPPFTYKWQKGTNGVYVDLADSGPWSGSATLTLFNSAATLADIADYRVRVSNGAGTAYSGAATVTVLSSDQNILQTTDPIVPVVNNSPAAEDVTKAIDNSTSKYLNRGLNSGSTTPVGFIVTPAMGSTFVTGIRLFTANDATERDPADSVLEGSNNGGNTWTLIWSNTFTLPDARNAAALSVDPLQRAMIERNFINSNPYTMYRWTVTKLKNRPAANSMQIGEVQLLGYANTSPEPIFLSHPLPVTVYGESGNSALFTALASGSPDPTYQWKKGTNGVYVNLVDGGNVFGSQTSYLTISPVDYADEADYLVAATNSAGYAFSQEAHLTVISPLTDITAPGDPVVVFGDVTANTSSAGYLLDNTTTAYVNGGHGPSALAGFPPFAGPVGAVITPVRGATVVTGLRFYTADGSANTDPADYLLEGSNDAGANYALVSRGTLKLPPGRNNSGLTLDPLSQTVSEVRFANNQAFTSYRLTFTNVNDNATSTSLRIAELEMLGLTGPSVTVTPGYVNSAEGGNAQFVAVATGSGLLTYQWKHGANGVYSNLVDGGRIFGSTTEVLNITGVTLADDGDYVVMVTDSVAPSSSQPVIVNVVSTQQDVTAPGDSVTAVGGSSPAAEEVLHAIDNLTDKYLNFGTDGDQNAPFVGPVGFTVTPAMGPTLVTGLRIYTANDASERDPADYKLEGSSNGGATYNLVAQGSVRLPSDRNLAGSAPDPIFSVNRELRFPNNKAYGSYRLTTTNVRNNTAANSYQVGEIDLLGVPASFLTITSGTGGTLTLTTSLPGTLWSTTEFKGASTVWVNEGPIAGTVIITPAPGVPAKFYRVSTP